MRHGFNPWVGKILWRRKWPPIPVFLPGNFHGQRSVVGYSQWIHKQKRKKRIDPLKDRRPGHWPMSSTMRVVPKGLTLLSSHHNSVNWERKIETGLLDGALAGWRPFEGGGGQIHRGCSSDQKGPETVWRGAPKAAAWGPKPIFGSTTWAPQP